MFDSLQQIKISPFEIDKKEVLYYLGHQGQALDPQLDQSLNTCINLVSSKIHSRYVCQSFKITKTEDSINVANTSLNLEGKAIAKLLKFSNQVVLMAATLGTEVEQLINYYQKTSLTQALLLDAAATVAIEQVCDFLQQEISKIHPITNRFSCGYGDLPLSIQPQIIQLLQANKTIGLFCNQQNILIPRKSVTAIMGILTANAPSPGLEGSEKKSCTNCQYSQSCLLKNSAGCGKNCPLN